MHALGIGGPCVLDVAVLAEIKSLHPFHLDGHALYCDPGSHQHFCLRQAWETQRKDNVVDCFFLPILG